MRHFCGKRDSVFGGQARHAAEAVVGVVGGDGTLRRLGQPVVLVIGIGAGVRTWPSAVVKSQKVGRKIPDNILGVSRCSAEIHFNAVFYLSC